MDATESKLIENGDEIDKIIMEWLDKKNKGSTVFVDFGTELSLTLTKEEIQEIALGLELSKVNFLWNFRMPLGEETKINDVLPEGFLERVRERGMIRQTLVPQVKILSHSSIGGFMSHCGWSSVIESFTIGVPIIGIPKISDAPFDEKLVENAGVGVEVWREKDHGGMKGEEIAKTINKVVVETDGEIVRAKARKVADILRSKEEDHIAMVVDELTSLCMVNNYIVAGN